MFSGYIGDCGQLKKTEKMPHGVRFHIASSYTDLERGESIAVDGICLTVTDITPTGFACDLSPETLQCTRAGSLKEGAHLNLERSLRLNERLNGHLVMGHVDQTCLVTVREDLSDYVQFRFSGIKPEAQALVVYKGSIAINGVSLTLNTVEGDEFEVMLIPETLAKTNLSSLSLGDMVNVEYDYFARLIAKQIQHIQSSTYKTKRDTL